MMLYTKYISYFPSGNYDTIYLEISMGTNNLSILIGLVYCYPGNSISDFTRKFLEFLIMNNILIVRKFAFLVILA